VSCGCRRANTTAPLSRDYQTCYSDYPTVQLSRENPWVSEDGTAYQAHIDVSAGQNVDDAPLLTVQLNGPEYVFGLPPLTATSPDNGAYYWANMFDFGQSPLPPVTMKASRIPPSSQQFLATHPVSQEQDPDS
jgi:hypothetical protein